MRTTRESEHTPNQHPIDRRTESAAATDATPSQDSNPRTTIFPPLRRIPTPTKQRTATTQRDSESRNVPPAGDQQAYGTSRHGAKTTNVGNPTKRSTCTTSSYSLTMATTILAEMKRRGQTLQGDTKGLVKQLTLLSIEHKPHQAEALTKQKFLSLLLTTDDMDAHSIFVLLWTFACRLTSLLHLTNADVTDPLRQHRVHNPHDNLLSRENDFVHRSLQHTWQYPHTNVGLPLLPKSRMVAEISGTLLQEHSDQSWKPTPRGPIVSTRSTPTPSPHQQPNRPPPNEQARLSEISIPLPFQRSISGAGKLKRHTR